MLDWAANGQQLKCMTVIDGHPRDFLSILVDGHIRSGKLVAELTRLVSLPGAPKHIRSDNGPGFVSETVIKWLPGNQFPHGVQRPRKPWPDGAAESFNGKSRDECLNLDWFQSRAEARVVVDKWRHKYNRERPH